MDVALGPEHVPNPLPPPGAELGSSAPSNPKNCVGASSEKPQIATHVERARSARARGKGETRAGPKGTIPPGHFRAKGNHSPRLGAVIRNIHCSRAPPGSCARVQPPACPHCRCFRPWEAAMIPLTRSKKKNDPNLQHLPDANLGDAHAPGPALVAPDCHRQKKQPKKYQLFLLLP